VAARAGAATKTPTNPATVELDQADRDCCIEAAAKVPLSIRSIYLQGIDNAEIIDAVHGRKQPMVSGQRVVPGLSTSPPTLLAA
jgi:hypothetical protein